MGINVGQFMFNKLIIVPSPSMKMGDILLVASNHEADIILKKEMFYLMMLSTHFIYSYMVSDIW